MPYGKGFIVIVYLLPLFLDMYQKSFFVFVLFWFLFLLFFSVFYWGLCGLSA